MKPTIHFFRHRSANFTAFFKCFAFLLIVICKSVNTYGQAQNSCNTKLGIPVLFEDFGKGVGVVNLPPATTTYSYSGGNNNFPTDGEYAVTNSTKYLSAEIETTYGWLKLNDHTSADTLGRMLVVNADANKAAVLFRKDISGLCADAKYEVSVWITNLMTFKGCAGANPANVTFQVIDKLDNNKVLGSINTGDIATTKGTPEWKKYSFMLPTIGTGTVTILLKNDGLGGCGNDLAIDDISFAPCGSFSTLTVAPPPCGGGNYSIAISGVTLPAPWYQWQKSNDNGVTWSNVNSPAQTNILNENQLNAGNSPVTILYQALFATTVNNLESGSACRYVSDPIAVIIPPVIKANFEWDEVCPGQAHNIINTSTPKGNNAIYEWYIDDVKQTAGIDPSGNLTYIFAPPAATHKIKLIALFNNNCKNTKETTITIEPEIDITINYEKAALKCFGDSNAGLKAVIKSGVAPYSLKWYPGGQVTDEISNLKAGTYTLYVADAKGCKDTAIATVLQPSSPLKLEAVTVAASCGNANGSISVKASGGTPGYIYKWAPISTAGPDAFGLQAGIYSLTVTDQNGCKSEEVLVVNNINGPSISQTVVQPGCGKSDGSINITASGGTFPFTYQWNTGATTPLLNNLSAGTYSCKVTDVNACVAYAVIKLNNPNPPLVKFEYAGKNTLCATASEVTLSGGIPAGGTYTGSGVNAGKFNPANATAGWNTISYTYVDGNNCPGTATDKIYVKNCIPAGVNTVTAAEAISIYPNPASSILTIDFESTNSKLLSIKLISISGTLIFAETGNFTGKYSKQFSILDYAKGVYFMQVITDKSVVVKRVIMR